MHRALAERTCVTFVSVVCFLLVGVSADAQPPESIGIRAQGMAGAFTAVADDATAAWWNPAGLAGGAYFSAILEYGHPKTPPDTDIKGISLAFPALGLSYYRLPVSHLRPAGSTEQASASRQDEGPLSVFGATVGQSLGNHFVVGSTLKVVRAADSHPGLDAGAMATFGKARVGL